MLSRPKYGLCLYLTLAIWLLFALLNSPLKDISAPNGVVSVDSVTDPLVFGTLVQEWHDRGVFNWLWICLALDFFAFIPIYVLALSTSYRRVLPELALWNQKVCNTVLFLPAIAGALNAFQDILKLLLLGTDWTTPGVPPAWLLRIEFGLGAGKFLAVGVCLFFLAGGALLSPEWRKATNVVHSLRFSIEINLLLYVVLNLAPQATDALRLMGEEVKFRWTLTSLVMVAFFGIISWYWARLLTYLIHSELLWDRTPPADWWDNFLLPPDQWLARFGPRLCGIAAPLSLALALRKAYIPSAINGGTAVNQALGILSDWCLVIAFLLFVGLAARRNCINKRPAFHIQKDETKTAEWYRIHPSSVCLGVLSFFPSLVLTCLMAHIPETSPSRICVFGSAALCALVVTLKVKPKKVKGLVWVCYIGIVSVTLALLPKNGDLWPIWFGPAATSLAGAALLIPGGSALAYYGKRWRIPLLEGVVVVALIFDAKNLNDNHFVRQLPDPVPAQLPETSQAFAHWLSTRPDLNEYVTRDDMGQPEGSYPVIVASAEGGGIRAEYEAAYTMAALQDASIQGKSAGPDLVKGSFAVHTFAISGVSGGSLGSAVFAAMAHAHGGEPFSYAKCANRVAGADLLSPSVASLLTVDFFERFLPFTLNRPEGGMYFDCSLELENALESSWRKAGQGDEFHNSLLNLYPDAFGQTVTTGYTPYLFLNSTCQENGKRFVDSPLTLKVSPGTAGANPDAGSPAADIAQESHLELSDFPGTHQFPLSTAAVLSARFPIISSAGFLERTEPAQSGSPVTAVRRYHMVDGGYFDNYGATTLSEIIGRMQQAKPKWQGSANGATIPWRLYVLRIGYNSELDPKTTSVPWSTCQYPKLGSIKAPGGDPLQEYSSPVFAFARVAGDHATTQIRPLEESLPKMKTPSVSATPSPLVSATLCPFIYRQEADNVELPLGWELSKASRHELRLQMKSAFAKPSGTPVPVTDCGVDFCSISATSDQNSQSVQTIMQALKPGSSKPK